MTIFEWLVLGIVAVNGMAWIVWVIWGSRDTGNTPQHTAWLESEIMKLALDVKHRLWQLRALPEDLAKIEKRINCLQRENTMQRDRITILEAACEKQLKEWRGK